MILCLQPTAHNTKKNTKNKSQKHGKIKHKLVPGPFPKTYSKKVLETLPKSDLWGHQNRRRTHQNRAQSPSDTGLIPELKRGLKAVKGGPGTSKESPGGSAFAKKAPK